MVLGSGPHNPTQFFWEYLPPGFRTTLVAEEIPPRDLATAQELCLGGA